MAVGKFTRLIYDGKEIEVYGDGKALRDFTYVGDIVDGIIRSIHRPFDYEIINIGGSRTVEVSYLIEVIEASLGKKPE